jgi:hypothetical protein
VSRRSVEALSSWVTIRRHRIVTAPDGTSYRWNMGSSGASTPWVRNYLPRRCPKLTTTAVSWNSTMARNSESHDFTLEEHESQANPGKATWKSTLVSNILQTSLSRPLFLWRRCAVRRKIRRDGGLEGVIHDGWCSELRGNSSDFSSSSSEAYVVALASTCDFLV